MPSDYEAAVVGAGPGGLSTVAALLDTGIEKIMWIDKDWTGGRLNTLYREISSNTKTGIYLDAIYSSPACKRVIESTPKPNAVTRLEELDRDETCQLSLAGDMVMMLISGLLDGDGPGVVEKCVDVLEGAELESETWSLCLSSGRRVTTDQLHLSTGASPRKPDWHKQYSPDLTVLDLDQTMVLSSLPSQLPAEKRSTVGIIGNSHSGILACMNFHTVATEGKRDVKVINFQRREILFAEYREDGIVWDNSGLKGRTADWAKKNMVDRASRNTNNIVEQVRLDQADVSEEEVYKARLPECTHLVYAIGYDPSPLPHLSIQGHQGIENEIKFDMHSSGFRLHGRKVHGLYGTGIAFPEETADPEGHVEAAVGLAKFFKFAERVKADWGKVC